MSGAPPFAAPAELATNLQTTMPGRPTLADAPTADQDAIVNTSAPAPAVSDTPALALAPPPLFQKPVPPSLPAPPETATVPEISGDTPPLADAALPDTATRRTAAPEISARHSEINAGQPGQTIDRDTRRPDLLPLPVPGPAVAALPTTKRPDRPDTSPPVTPPDPLASARTPTAPDITTPAPLPPANDKTTPQSPVSAPLLPAETLPRRIGPAALPPGAPVRPEPAAAPSLPESQPTRRESPDPAPP
ncbi:MAG: hypothetical protein ACC646_04765, partial [Paracoccaceae bacterium]